jgi:hypothetical protein
MRACYVLYAFFRRFLEAQHITRQRDWAALIHRFDCFEYCVRFAGMVTYPCP